MYYIGSGINHERKIRRPKTNQTSPDTQMAAKKNKIERLHEGSITLKLGSHLPIAQIRTKVGFVVFYLYLFVFYILTSVAWPQSGNANKRYLKSVKLQLKMI